jgi:hypothetical protein
MMYRLILSRALLVLCSVFASASAYAFAVFVVPFNSVPPPGTLVTVEDVVIPAELGQGVPLIWTKTSNDVTLALAPDPPSPLTNGTTTWNANADSAIEEWASVGANFRFVGDEGSGDPCITDMEMVVGFDPTVCIGFVPPPLLGISRLVAIVASATTISMVDADVALITPDTLTDIGNITWDAFDGPIIPPTFDIRRVLLHEFGHSQGLAHPDMVFGDTPATRKTVMHSQSVVEKLSRDDKNGVLALYPPLTFGISRGSGGGGSGGGGNALILALLLAGVVSIKFLRSRARHA